MANRNSSPADVKQSIASLFACTYSDDKTCPVEMPAVPSEQQPAERTYGQRFEKMCAEIVEAKTDSPVTDYRDLEPGSKNIYANVLLISGIANPIYLDKVTAKVLIIDTCAEVNIGEVAVDHITIQECKRVALAGVDAENILTYKCLDITVAEFRTKYGILQSHRVRLGDGSCKHMSVLSDVLFVDGALDRMSNWDLYSPILHIGPMVPPISPSKRMRVYANTHMPSDWTDVVGVCDLKKIIWSANTVFGSATEAVVISEEDRNLVTGLDTFNSLITFLCGGNTSFTMMNSVIKATKESIDQIDAATKEAPVVMDDEQVSVFFMITETERKVILPVPMQQLNAPVMISAKGNENTVLHSTVPDHSTMSGDIQIPEEFRQQLATAQEEQHPEDVLRNNATKAERAAAAQAERRPQQNKK